MSSTDGRTPLTPQRMNIFGRKRYSVETNASDYQDYSFDDVWAAIGRLWLAVAILGLGIIYLIRRRSTGR